MTNATADTMSTTTTLIVPSTETQQVVIINGNAEILESLQTMLDAGHYDVIFVESTAHAYSHIKRVQPDLVILCVHMDDAAGVNVLSMLQLDPLTRDIPVLTYTTPGTVEAVEEEEDDQDDERSTSTLFVSKPAAWMN